ncbi:MAG TPA: glycoside hydrolase family 3 N-terminal domain-containing protein, partial [Solirubrobacteraceae bacterium]|nr:glycoside hydrolase family 3 N-terminal domain-containing protein [Solirubrobacteraceae bacterium]
MGQALILSFEGPTVPGYVQRALREGRVAGVILFADNIVSPGQLRRLTATLQRASGHGALIMVDQEGGPVEIVPFAAPAVGQARQETAQEAAVQASAAGRELRSLGVNVNLAPVADVPSVDGAALAGRAFAGEAGAVAARVTAAVRAYDAAGVGSTAKHFPGLGAARANTDQAPVTIPFLTSQDLAPFKAAVAAGVPLVM